jgi:hypothetical protein
MAEELQRCKGETKKQIIRRDYTACRNLVPWVEQMLARGEIRRMAHCRESQWVTRCRRWRTTVTRRFRIGTPDSLPRRLAISGGFDEEADNLECGSFDIVNEGWSETGSKRE